MMLNVFITWLLASYFLKTGVSDFYALPSQAKALQKIEIRISFTYLVSWLTNTVTEDRKS